MKIPRNVVALLLRDDEVCACSRRNRPWDLGLPGGKIDPEDHLPGARLPARSVPTPFPQNHALAALFRETKEEIGVVVEDCQFVFERIDPTDGDVAWCYYVRSWLWDPRQMEPGIDVSWQKPERLLQTNCTFREYNRSLFQHIGLIR